MALGIIGFLGVAVCIAWLIVSAIQKKKKRNSLIGMGICVIAFIVGLSLPSSEPTMATASSAASSSKMAKSQSVSTQSSSKANNPPKEDISSNEVSADDSAYTQALEKAQQELDSEQSSESDGKITKEAYDKIHSGMSYAEVKKIVGSDGDAYFESGDKGTDNYVVNYLWHGKNGLSTASITCTGKEEKIVSKSQGGLK